MAAFDYVMDMRKVMAKTELTITCKTKHEKEMVLRTKIGKYLLRFTAWFIGVKLIELDWTA